VAVLGYIEFLTTKDIQEEKVVSAEEVPWWRPEDKPKNKYGICWADGLSGEISRSGCTYTAVTPLGLCLLCYVDILGELPEGYTLREVLLAVRQLNNDVERYRRYRSYRKVQLAIHEHIEEGVG